MTDPVDTDALRRMGRYFGKGPREELALAAADEVDRLRAVIENAPHDGKCAYATEGFPSGYCDCWKADAL